MASGFRLVDATFVANCLVSPDPAFPLVVLEAHFTSCDHPLPANPRFTSRHLPGAIQVHPSFLEAGLDRTRYYPAYSHPDDGDLLPDAELTAALESIGIIPGSQVIVYGSEPDGAMAAARLAWGLMYAGVRQVALLDGGIGAWLAHGGTVAPAIATVWDIAPLPRVRRQRWRVRRELRASTDEVREVVVGCWPSPPAARLIDVRSLGEWDGTISDFYEFFSAAGHIPTAIHQGDWETLLDADTERILPAVASIDRRWRELQIIDAGVEAGETTLIFYCGTGWRASLAVLVASVLGLRAKNFDAGFYGWSWDRSNPITLCPPGSVVAPAARGAGCGGIRREVDRC